MIALDVPAPELAGTPAAAPHLEQPVLVKLSGLHFPDGSEATDAYAQTVGAYVYRLRAAGEELWNEAEQRWTNVPEDPSALPPLPLQYKAGEAQPWQGLLIAIGMTDKDGKERFDPASGGDPRYRLRAHVRFKRDGAEYSGLSSPSATLEFVKGVDSQRFQVTMDPNDPQQTQEVTLRLRNAGLVDAGYLRISTKSGPEVEVANLDASGAPLASVLLAADGTIRLKPATGKKIVLEGDLEAHHIRYQPAGGGAARDL